MGQDIKYPIATPTVTHANSLPYVAKVLSFFFFLKQLVATDCKHSNHCLPGDGDQDEKVTGVWLMATTVGYTCATTPQNIVVATCSASELRMYHLMVDRRWMDGSGPAKKVTDGSHCGWAN